MITENNALFSGLLGDQFKLEMEVIQISKEELNKLEVLPVSLLVTTS